MRWRLWVAALISAATIFCATAPMAEARGYSGGFHGGYSGGMSAGRSLGGSGGFSSGRSVYHGTSAATAPRGYSTHTASPSSPRVTKSSAYSLHTQSYSSAPRTLSSARPSYSSAPRGFSGPGSPGAGRSSSPRAPTATAGAGSTIRTVHVPVVIYGPMYHPAPWYYDHYWGMPWWWIWWHQPMWMGYGFGWNYPHIAWTAVILIGVCLWILIRLSRRRW